MPGNFKGEDIRVQRTKGALMDAMSKLLELRNFNQITVNDLCEEARIGKSTFYVHYYDKYDLLQTWLAKSEIMLVHKDIEKTFSDFVKNNSRIVRHLIEDANSETLGLMCEFMLSLMDIDQTDIGQISPKYAVLSKFCCGGIMNYLEWRVKNQTKDDLKITNSYFCEILIAMHEWDKNHQ